MGLFVGGVKSTWDYNNWKTLHKTLGVVINIFMGRLVIMNEISWPIFKKFCAIYQSVKTCKRTSYLLLAISIGHAINS
jgi:hypothetical protein